MSLYLRILIFWVILWSIPYAEQLVFNKGHKAIFMAYRKNSTPKWTLDFYIREGYKVVEKDKGGFMLYKSIQEDFQA